jgi:hypothetical protein
VSLLFLAHCQLLHLRSQLHHFIGHSRPLSLVGRRCCSVRQGCLWTCGSKPQCNYRSGHVVCMTSSNRC